MFYSTFFQVKGWVPSQIFRHHRAELEYEIGYHSQPGDLVIEDQLEQENRSEKDVADLVDDYYYSEVTNNLDHVYDQFYEPEYEKFYEPEPVLNI